MKCCSFFAGAGGIDLGFDFAGFESIYANELDSFAVQTLRENFKFEISHKDIRNVNENELPNFDVLLAGFPCQAFSIAGKGEGFQDSKGRGELFFEVSRIIKARKPRLVFLENVKNLSTHDNGNTLKVILNTLHNIGYTTKHQVLNACQYGNIPQNRERIYIVAFRDERDAAFFNFPPPLELTTKINDLLLNKDVGKEYFYTPNSKIFKHLKDAVTNPNTIYQWRRKYVRENKKGLCPTLTANMGTGGHNVPIITMDGTERTIRKLTPRECFNMQGFPASFKLPSNLSNAQLYKQAGNSVVVTVIERIAIELKKALESSDQSQN